MTSLQDKVAIVSGAGKNIGRSVAQRLHASGCKVAVVDIDIDAAALVASELDAEGKSVRPYCLDVRNVGDIAAIHGRICQDLGTPSLLVNNAAYIPSTPALDMTEAIWDQVLDTNLKGTFFCTQAFARELVKKRMSGAVVNLASTAAFSARVGASHYSASKAGIVMLTKSLAQELGPHCIRINAVAPGLVETPGMRESLAYRQQFAIMVPSGRIATIADISNMVMMLLSDEASFVNGECIVVDGGFLAGRALQASA